MWGTIHAPQKGASFLECHAPAFLATHLGCIHQSTWLVCLKVSLVDPGVLPALPRLLGDASAPVTHGGVLDGGILPNPPLGFDDPVDLALPGSLYSNPVWIVEPNSATRLKVVDAK